MLRCIRTLAINSVANVRLSFFSKSLELRHLAFFARLLKLFDRLDAQLIVNRFDFLRSEARNLQHLPIRAVLRPEALRNRSTFPWSRARRFSSELTRRSLRPPKAVLQQ